MSTRPVLLVEYIPLRCSTPLQQILQNYSGLFLPRSVSWCSSKPAGLSIETS